MTDDLFRTEIPGNLKNGESVQEFNIPQPKVAGYKTFDFAAAAAAYEMDLVGLEVTVVKVKTGRWLLCKEDGTVLASKRSESDILATAGKIELRRDAGNLHGYRFGKRIDSTIVKGYAVAVWGERFNYENIEFDGHYWWADIVDPKTGKRAEHLRMDYHINYERLPEFAFKAA